MVGSTKTDPSLGAVEIPHEGDEECKSIRTPTVQYHETTRDWLTCH
jgi:hypothetical protein